MSKLDDILKYKLDYTELTTQLGKDRHLDKTKQELKDLFKEIVNSSSLTLQSSETEVCPTSVLLEKIEEL